MDLPLLVTVYFTLIRQNKIFGIALGTGLGLTQDALSHGYLGMFGMAKALVGYLAASAATRFNVESLFTRSVVTASLIHSTTSAWQGFSTPCLTPQPPSCRWT
jgi:rod shape-determining protein MreD